MGIYIKPKANFGSALIPENISTPINDPVQTANRTEDLISTMLNQNLLVIGLGLNLPVLGVVYDKIS